MNTEILFMPLGGGQRVGASCYYLQLGNNHIILDAGIGNNKNLKFNPVISQLTALHSFYSLDQINQIFISHAHMDHVGYLFDLMSEATQSGVYMTDITKSLMELQLYERIFLGQSRQNERKRLTAQSHMDRITAVSYLKPINFGDYHVTFYPAGHIPGAMMMLFEYKDRTILYTGDYSIDNSPLVSGCVIPRDKKIDTIIMCGLHAKHPNYRNKSDKIFSEAEQIYEEVLRYGKSIQCSAVQLSKGIEFLKILNDNNKYNIPVFVDNSIMQIVRKMEQNGIRILDINNKQMLDEPPLYPHIFLTTSGRMNPYYYSKRIDVNFTLHEDFMQMKQFIKSINPRHVVLVHCAKSHSPDDITIEQELLFDGDCRTQFTFAEEQEIYKL